MEADGGMEETERLLRRCEVVSIERPAPMHHPWLFSRLLNPLPPFHQRYNPVEHLIITINRQWPL